MPSSDVHLSTRSRFEQLLHRGALRDILVLSVDSPSGEFPADCLFYVVSALVFSGRVDDALVIFERGEAHLEADALAGCRFVLGIGLVRISRYEDGLAHLVRNLRQARSQDASDQARFYAWQGVAFYRFFQCRFQSSLQATRMAWAAALRGTFKFGQALAADLRAHALICTGQIAAGMRSFEDALRLASTLGNGALRDNIHTSMTNYQAMHGLGGSATVEKQKKILAEFDPQDNFSLASAQIELARQLCLQGAVDESEKYLQAAARVVLVAGHRRQKALLLHRYAYNRFLMGRTSEADDFLDKALAALDIRFDLYEWLQISGLRLRLRENEFRTGNSGADSLTALRAQVLSLTLRTGSGIGRNILWREAASHGFNVPESLTPTLTGDDPLGDLRHLCARGEETRYADVSRILESGLYGFLHLVMPFPVGSRVVCLDLVPGELFVFDRGNVVRSGSGISTVLKTLALALSKGARSKKDLVELIWGYQYHALRHDPLLYALVNRLRHALGRHTEWLIATSGEYVWDSSVSVLAFEHRETSSVVLRKRSPPLHSPDEFAEEGGAELNHRQLMILSELERHKFLNATECAAMFKVARVTATRDLSGLARTGFIQRFGKGRATHYAAKRDGRD